jgi:hypothetical protein
MNGPLRCLWKSYAFGEPTITRLGALILIPSALASPPAIRRASAIFELLERDPKTGGEVPSYLAGSRRMTDTAQVEVFCFF